MTDEPVTPTVRGMPGSLRGVLWAAAITGSIGAVGCTSSVAPQSPNQSAADTDAIADAVQRYFTAYNAGDLTALNDATCTGAQRTEATPPRFPTVVHSIGTPDQAGDGASVPVTMSLERGETNPTIVTVSITVVKENGAWKFCMVERSSSR